MTLRIAVLGTGHYHANFWTRAFTQSLHATVSGVWDRDAARASTFASRHAIEAVADLNSFIDASDAVAICSASNEHLAFVEAAAAKGRPVLCEKPLGIDRRQGEAIAAVVAKRAFASCRVFRNASILPITRLARC